MDQHGSNAVRGRFTVPSLSEIKKSSKINTHSKPSLFKKAKDDNSLSSNIKAKTDSQAGNSLASSPIRLDKDAHKVTRSTLPAVESVIHNANSVSNASNDVMSSSTDNINLGCHKTYQSDKRNVKDTKTGGNDTPHATFSERSSSPVRQTDNDHYGQSSSTSTTSLSVASTVSIKSIVSVAGPPVSMETKDQAGTSGAVTRKTYNPRSIIVNIVQVC